MAVTPADVRALSLTSEFDSDPPFSDAAIQARIDRAQLFVGTDVWPSGMVDEGVKNLAAHFLLVDNSGEGTGAGGVVTSKSVGDVSVSYGDPGLPTNDAILGQTSYGRTYLALRSVVPYTGTTSTSEADALAGEV